jgi:hypothetical protein
MDGAKEISRIAGLLNSGPPVAAGQGWVMRLLTSIRTGGLFNRVHNTIIVNMEGERTAQPRMSSREKTRRIYAEVRDIAKRFPDVHDVKGRAMRALLSHFGVSGPRYIAAARLDEAIAFVRAWRP